MGMRTCLGWSLAILLGAATAGAAGSLHAHFNGSVSPQMFLWSQSVTLLTMVVADWLEDLVAMLRGS